MPPVGDYFYRNKDYIPCWGKVVALDLASSVQSYFLDSSEINSHCENNKLYRVLRKLIQADFITFPLYGGLCIIYRTEVLPALGITMNIVIFTGLRLWAKLVFSMGDFYCWRHKWPWRTVAIKTLPSFKLGGWCEFLKWHQQSSEPFGENRFEIGEDRVQLSERKCFIVAPRKVSPCFRYASLHLLHWRTQCILRGRGICNILPFTAAVFVRRF